ncbi:tRNA (adenine-N1)-methyltransferase [Thermosulfuriphilus sp.]
MEETIREGDWVLLVSGGRSYLLRVERRSFQTHRDSLDLGQLLGRRFGEVFQGKKGEPFFALRPTIYDQLMKIRRATQIIYPKDIGYILLKLGVGPGKTVVECGTGSGSLLLALAWAVGDKGRVITYERQERHLQLARENAQRAGLEGRIVFKGPEVEPFEEEETADALFLDLKTPWELIASAWRALRGGSPIGILVPTANQVSETLRVLEKYPFCSPEVLEIMIRFYKVNPERFRPEDRMVGHTGYLIFARKVYSSPSAPSQEEDQDRSGDESSDVGPPSDSTA